MTDVIGGSYKRRAIALAQDGERNPGGYVIVLDGRIIGEGHNQTHGNYDPTVHGEVLAMRRAGAAMENRELGGYALQHAATVWHVHHGLDLGEDRPDRLRCRAR